MKKKEFSRIGALRRSFSFLHGMRSIFMFDGSSDLMRMRSYFSDQRSDSEAICSDWSRVGKSIQVACDQFEKQHVEQIEG